MRASKRDAVRCAVLASLLATGLATAACSAHERRGLSLGSACNQDFQCDDAHVCNGVERCLAGACALGETPDCDDDDACTRDGCTEGLGCVHVTHDAPMCRPEAPALDGGDDAQRPIVDAEVPDATLPDAQLTDAELPSEPEVVLPKDLAHAPDVECNSVVAQLNVTTQEALDRFDGIECVLGALHVSGEIETLEPLRNLRWVGMGATFMDIDTRHLVDLDRLERVDADLIFYSNGELYWLQGLSSLRWVAGSFVLYETYTEPARTYPAVNVVTGPPKLRNVGGDLIMTAGAWMEGFDSLERVGGSVTVSAPDLKGFPVLTSIEGNLIFTRVGGAEVTSFPALSHIGDSFIVQANEGLRSLAGFTALEHVGRLVDIRANPQLEALTDSLQYAENFDVRLNPQLSRCAVDALIARARSNGSRAEPVTCCNRGCQACLASACDVAGSPLAGQSTHYVGEIRSYDDFPFLSLLTMTRATSLDLREWTRYDLPVPPLPLERVDESLAIYNAGSRDLASFTRLEQVGGLSIGLGWMTTLEGLENLREVSNALTIYDNSQLVDLSALDPARGGALERFGGGYLQVYDNASLPSCEAQAFSASVAALASPPVTPYVSGGIACDGTCDGLMCVPLPEPPDAGIENDAGDASEQYP